MISIPLVSPRVHMSVPRITTVAPSLGHCHHSHRPTRASFCGGVWGGVWAGSKEGLDGSGALWEESWGVWGGV